MWFAGLRIAIQPSLNPCWTGTDGVDEGKWTTNPRCRTREELIEGLGGFFRGPHAARPGGVLASSASQLRDDGVGEPEGLSDHLVHGHGRRGHDLLRRPQSRTVDA